VCLAQFGMLQTRAFRAAFRSLLPRVSLEGSFEDTLSEIIGGKRKPKDELDACDFRVTRLNDSMCAARATLMDSVEGPAAGDKIREAARGRRITKAWKGLSTITDPNRQRAVATALEVSVERGRGWVITSIFDGRTVTPCSLESPTTRAQRAACSMQHAAMCQVFERKERLRRDSLRASLDKWRERKLSSSQSSGSKGWSGWLMGLFRTDRKSDPGRILAQQLTNEVIRPEHGSPYGTAVQLWQFVVVPCLGATAHPFHVCTRTTEADVCRRILLPDRAPRHTGPPRASPGCGEPSVRCCECRPSSSRPSAAPA
jgi:hypothetical protein